MRKNSPCYCWMKWVLGVWNNLAESSSPWNHLMCSMRRMDVESFYTEGLMSLRREVGYWKRSGRNCWNQTTGWTVLSQVSVGLRVLLMTFRGILMPKDTVGRRVNSCPQHVWVFTGLLAIANATELAYGRDPLLYLKCMNVCSDASKGERWSHFLWWGHVYQ